MIGVGKIEVTRAEGPVSGTTYPVGKTVTVKTFAETDRVLRAIALDKHMRHSGCYDKVDFVIHYKDGRTYSGRFDCECGTRFENTPLASHIQALVDFVTGKKKPSWMTDELWEEAKENERRSGNAKRFGKFAETYTIGDPPASEVSP